MPYTLLVIYILNGIPAITQIPFQSSALCQEAAQRLTIVFNARTPKSTPVMACLKTQGTIPPEPLAPR